MTQNFVIHAECRKKAHCAECRYAECRGAIKTTRNAECHSLTHYAKRCFTGCGVMTRHFSKSSYRGKFDGEGKEDEWKNLKENPSQGT